MRGPVLGSLYKGSHYLGSIFSARCVWKLSSRAVASALVPAKIDGRLSWCLS